MAAVPFILPLCTIDDVRAELEDTERSIDRLGQFPVVDLERRQERLQILRRWQSRLRAQLAEMEASDA